MITKIREQTKLSSTLFGIFNVTQIVESESTMEKHIKFEQNCSGAGTIAIENNVAVILSSVVSKPESAVIITIANLSTNNKVAILVEEKEINDYRDEMISEVEEDNTGKNLKNVDLR